MKDVPIKHYKEVPDTCTCSEVIASIGPVVGGQKTRGTYQQRIPLSLLKKNRRVFVEKHKADIGNYLIVYSLTHLNPACPHFDHLKMIKELGSNG